MSVFSKANQTAMCGIAGAAWTASATPVTRDTLVRMTDLLAHRGPDDAGFYESPPGAAGAALGHRRLSIIDLAGGHQPLSNEDGTVWIVFNGEIYNYAELQPELEARGHRFRTASDTETIVHLYEEYGTDCVNHLRGMFAFALWDQRKQRLFLARDRLGQKPLVYQYANGRIVFASELKALLQIPGMERRVNPVAVAEYVALQYVPHPHSILQGFAKLPPAHWALFENGQFQVHRYWHAPFDEITEEDEHRSPAEQQRQLRETLTEAVRLRMRSDVPFGAFLSGGIDSTIIAGLMQQLSTRPVKTFSIGFPVKEFDERTYARMAAEHLQTEHHEAIVEPSALEMLPKLIWHYDEPFADSSAIPTMYLSEMTRRLVTVSLTGDGGDELFAGYRRYQAVRLAGYTDRLPRLFKRFLGARAWQKLPSSVRQDARSRQFKRLLSAIAHSPERRYLNWVSIFDDDRRIPLMSDDFLRELAGADAGQFLLDAYQSCPERDFVTQTTSVDVQTYLPCDILTKVDIASMAYGLECRSPLLDHRVVETAARLPITAKLRGKVSKKILIETFADLLPAPIRTRPKMGFGVPLSNWFRAELKPLVQDVLLDPVTLARGYFRPAAVEQLVQEHMRQAWDHSARLWSLLCLELWHRSYLDTTPARFPPGTRI